MYTTAMSRPTENPTPGYLLWRLATKLRAAVDRELAPLGLTHAQYTLLASLYGLARALEQAGLIERTGHPGDLRAVQLRLTDDGAAAAERAIAIVRTFQEEFTAPIGGTQSRPARDLVRTLQILLGSDHRSDSMTSARPRAPSAPCSTRSSTTATPASPAPSTSPCAWWPSAVPR